MKKLLSITILFILAHNSLSQPFSFVTKNDSIFTVLGGMSSDKFFTSYGQIFISDVKKAYIHSELTDYYINKFAEFQIPLFEARSVNDQELMNARTETIVYQKEEELSIQAINKKLLKFNETRSTGYGLQILGIAISGAGIGIGEPIVALGGSAMSLIGLITTASAGSHLRK